MADYNDHSTSASTNGWSGVARRWRWRTGRRVTCYIQHSLEGIPDDMLNCLFKAQNCAAWMTQLGRDHEVRW